MEEYSKIDDPWGSEEDSPELLQSHSNNLNELQLSDNHEESFSEVDIGLLSNKKQLKGDEPNQDDGVQESDILSQVIDLPTIDNGSLEADGDKLVAKPLTFKFKKANEGGFFSKRIQSPKSKRGDSNRFRIPGLEPSKDLKIPPNENRSPRNNGNSPNDSLSPNEPLSPNLDNVHDQDWDEGFTNWETDVAGRKVVYDDYTAIDWNYDFSAERIRKRQLLSEKGVLGYLKQQYDACQAWFIVLFLGIGCGLIAGFIDIVSEWLADFRTGYCTTAFYNNQSFCCWGQEDFDKCQDWRPWSVALGFETVLASYITQYFTFMLSGTLFALLAAVLVNRYALYAAGSGLAEVKTILGGFIIRGFLGKWTLLIKVLGLCLSVGSGLCLGKEGPLVHVACCCGNFVLRMFPKYRYNEAKKREILSAAASAGIAVAFGAPIGGVLFSLEEVSYYFPYKTMWRSFLSAMAAAVTLRTVNPFRTSKLVLFQVSYTTDWHGFEMIFFLILGVLGGLLGAFFIRMNLKVTSYRQSSWLSHYPVLQVAIVAIITAAVSYPNPYMRIDAAELLSGLFKECDGTENNSLCDENNIHVIVYQLLAAGTLKLFFSMITFGLEIPAGFYMPAMMVGACLGRVLGILVRYCQNTYGDAFIFMACKKPNCISPSTYAMVGAAALMGGMTRMTVTLVIIMFELTGALTYGLPIMTAVMTSKWVGDALGKGGLTDGLIQLNGYPFLDQKDDYIQTYTAASVMTRVEDLITIPTTGATIESLNKLLGYTSFKGFPVIQSNHDSMLIGYISRSELRAALEQGSLQHGVDGSSPCIFDILDSQALAIMEGSPFIDMRYWTDHTPLTVPPTQSMEMVIDLFCKMGVRYVLITQHGKLLGILTKKDVLRHLSFVNNPDLPQPLPSTRRT